MLQSIILQPLVFLSLHFTIDLSLLCLLMGIQTVCVQHLGAETQSQLYPRLMLFVTNNFHITLKFHKSEQSHLATSYKGHSVFKFILVDLKSFNRLVAFNSLFSLSFTL